MSTYTTELRKVLQLGHHLMVTSDLSLATNSSYPIAEHILPQLTMMQKLLWTYTKMEVKIIKLVQLELQ